MAHLISHIFIWSNPVHHNYLGGAEPAGEDLYQELEVLRAFGEILSEVLHDLVQSCDKWHCLLQITLPNLVDRSGEFCVYKLIVFPLRRREWRNKLKNTHQTCQHRLFLCSRFIPNLCRGNVS